MPSDYDPESLREQMLANHDLHLSNERYLKSILAQTEKTNGRVTTLEGVTARLDKVLDAVSARGENLGKLVEVQESRHSRDDARYVSAEAFAPVKAVVFGMVGLLLTGVLLGLLALVIKQ